MSEAPSWSDQAYAFLAAFAQSGNPFLAEDARAAAKEAGIADPPEYRAWSGVISKAVRAGLIEKVGTKVSKRPPAHGSPKALWQKKGVHRPVSSIINAAGLAISGLPADTRHRVTPELTGLLSRAYLIAKEAGL